MNRKRVVFAAAAALSSYAIASAALADSRLFSARTDQPDVTIEEGFVEGQPLAVAGKGGGVTFFRIENLAGDVPCTSNFAFVKSNGERTEAELDLCAANWELTLPVRGSADTATPASDATPPPDDARTVTITPDDASAGIAEVSLDRSPVAITGRQGNSVTIAIAPGPGGIQCQRDLGLKLMDGRIVTRRANICANNWSVVVMLGEDAATPPPTTAVTTLAPGLSPPPAEAAWSFFSADGNVALTNGIPETDAIEFSASCRQGSGQASISVFRVVPGLRQGLSVPVTFAAGAFSQTYNGVGSPFSEMTGGSNPQFTIPTTDPLWSAMIAEAQLIVGPGSVPPYVLSLKGSATPTRQFLATCAPAPVLVNPPVVQPIGPVPSGSVRYTCGDGSVITVHFNPGDGTAAVAEAGIAVPLLPRVPSAADRAAWQAGPFRLVSVGGDIRWFVPGRTIRVCRAG